MNVHLVTIAYNSPTALQRLCETAQSGRHRIVFHVFLHSQHVPTVAMCERLAAGPDVIYYPYGNNRGLSKSWNEGMLEAYATGADVVLITNDDIYFSDGDLDKIAERALTSPEHYIVTCAGFHLGFGQPLPSHGYSCFAINPIALQMLGCFDENLFPAYCEDQDYAYRARLAGLTEENCADTMVYHGGSSSIFSDPMLMQQNGLTHGLNMIYYQRKWGGDGGYETFVHPFNNPDFNHFIAAEQRHTPYGATYDRTDQSIVRF